MLGGTLFEIDFMKFFFLLFMVLARRQAVVFQLQLLSKCLYLHYIIVFIYDMVLHYITIYKFSDEVGD